MSIAVKAVVAAGVVAGALVAGAARLGPPAPEEDPVIREHGSFRPPDQERPPLKPGVQQSIDLEARGDLEGAARAAEAAAADGDRDARLQAGKLAILRNRLDEAERWVAPLVEADARDVDAHYDLALIDHRRGDLEAARARYEAALKADPRHADARYNLALILRELRDPDAARTEAEALARFHPADPRPSRLLAELDAG